ncbi:ATP-binding protein [Streptomyces sp. NBC_01390]|uniref:ATP-binding protein n=1 Tax=Streptomyces sp. NBC_01390 TaxID=2903850 RepID=UPI0032472957
MFVLPAAPASVSAARRKVRELLDAWGVDADTSDNALLITSELVTNALTHTASERIVCRLRLSVGRLHVEVEDENRAGTLPAQRRPGFDEQCGRGLLLVGVLSSDWGVRDAPHGSGRIVWAELPTAEAELTEASPAIPPSTASAAPAPSAPVATATAIEATTPTGVASPAEPATVAEAALLAPAPVRAAASVSAPAPLPPGAHATAPTLALPTAPSIVHAAPTSPTAHAALAAPAVQVVASAPWHPSAPHRIRPVPHSAEGIAPHGPYGTTAPHPPYSRS